MTERAPLNLSTERDPLPDKPWMTLPEVFGWLVFGEARAFDVIARCAPIGEPFEFSEDIGGGSRDIAGYEGQAHVAPYLLPRLAVHPAGAGALRPPETVGAKATVFNGRRFFHIVRAGAVSAEECNPFAPERERCYPIWFAPDGSARLALTAGPSLIWALFRARRDLPRRGRELPADAPLDGPALLRDLWADFRRRGALWSFDARGAVCAVRRGLLPRIPLVTGGDAAAWATAAFRENVAVRGVPEGEKAARFVPRDAWHGATFDCDGAGARFGGGIGLGSGLLRWPSLWWGLEVDVDHLRRRAPPPVDPRALEIVRRVARLERSALPAARQSDPRDEAERIARAVVAEAEAAGVRPTKAEFIADLRARFKAESDESLSGRRAGRLWEIVAPAAWTKAGRPSKSSHPPA